MRAVHRHEPPLHDVQDPALAVDKPQPSGEQTAAQVQLPSLVELGQAIVGPPAPVIDREIKGQPVRGVHQLLVDAVLALYRAAQPVVYPREIGARVVHAVVRVLRHRTTRRKVAVAQGRERFPVGFVNRIETLIHQPPRVRTEHPEVELGHVIEDEVRTGPLEVPALARSVDRRHEAEPAPPGGRDPRDRVLDDRRPLRRDTELARGLEERSGIRLAWETPGRRDVAVDYDVEHPLETGCAQQRLRVPARCDQGQRGASRSQPLEQARRTGEDTVPFGRGELEEDLVLASCEPVHRPGGGRVVGTAKGYVDATCLEKGDHPVLAGPAVDVAAVVLQDVEGAQRAIHTGTWIGEYRVEHALPRRRVQRGGVGDHTVHVENDRVVRRLHARTATLLDCEAFGEPRPHEFLLCQAAARVVALIGRRIVLEGV